MIGNNKNLAHNEEELEVINDSLYGNIKVNSKIKNQNENQADNKSKKDDKNNHLEKNYQNDNTIQNSLIQPNDLFSPSSFDIKIIYNYNEKIIYPINYGLWYLYHQKSKSSFGPLSSKEIEAYYIQGKINAFTKIRMIDIFNFLDKEPFSFVKIIELEDLLESLMPSTLSRFTKNLKVDSGLKSFIKFEEEPEKKEKILKDDIFIKKENSWDEKYIPVKSEPPKKMKNKKRNSSKRKINQYENEEITIIKTNNQDTILVTESILDSLNNKKTVNPVIQANAQLQEEKILDAINDEEWKEIGIGKKKPQKPKNKVVGIQERSNDAVIRSGMLSKPQTNSLYTELKRKAEAKELKTEKLFNEFNNLEKALQNQVKNSKPNFVELNVKLSKYYLI
jgi:hypothetical protein